MISRFLSRFWYHWKHGIIPVILALLLLYFLGVLRASGQTIESGDCLSWGEIRAISFYDASDDRSYFSEHPDVIAKIGSWELQRGFEPSWVELSPLAPQVETILYLFHNNQIADMTIVILFRDETNPFVLYPAAFTMSVGESLDTFLGWCSMDSYYYDLLKSAIRVEEWERGAG